MKKIYFCLPAILTGVLQLSAQDIITKCNGEEIAAKVAEIGDTQIKYRKYENAQGPLYTLPASEVFLIRFEDGTREVVTPLDAPAVSPATAAETTGTESSTTAPAAANENYAQINRSVKRTKEPLRDKHFYIGPRAEFGYAAITSKSGNISGPVCSAGVIAEYMFDKMSPHGAGAGISYDMYMFEEDFDLNCMNIDLYYVYRPRALELLCRVQIRNPGQIRSVRRRPENSDEYGRRYRDGRRMGHAAFRSRRGNLHELQ